MKRPSRSPARTFPLRIRYQPGLAALLLVVVLVLGVARLPGAAEPGLGGAPADAHALVLDIDGAIGPATAEYLRQGLERAAEQGARAVVLRIDTPGGLSTSTREIVQAILGAPVPIITYVAPSGARAASAGTFIVYASHVAAMAPGTNLGAATPIALGGGGPLGGGGEDGDDDGGDAAAGKAVSDAAAFIRGLADLRGRNADWAERAVREAASLSARRALEENVVDVVARDMEGVLARADGRTVQVRGQEVVLGTAGLQLVHMEPDWRVRFMQVITDPSIAYILMLVGVYGIIFELASPGTIFPGVIGAIALVVGLFALNLMPINYAGVALLLLGVALMAAEAFAPSFGILGIGGAVAFALGSLFMFDHDLPEFTLSLPVVLTATAASAGLLIVALAAVVRAHRRKVATGEPAMLGAAGRVVEWSGGRGQVQVFGERWQARAAAPLSPGDRVRVLSRQDLTLVVEPTGPTTEED